MAAAKIVLDNSPWGRALQRRVQQLSSQDLEILTSIDNFKAQTSASVLSSIKPLITKYGKSWMQRVSDKLVPFLSHIGSFSSIISVYVQADPTFTGLLWGSIFLLISVACRSRGTMERIIDMLEDLTRNVSLFRRWAILFPEKDYTELGAMLETVYYEIIDFCVEAVKYFRRSKIANLCRVAFLPSFEVDFRDRVDRMRKLTEMVRIEVDSAHMHATKADLSAMRGLVQELPKRADTDTPHQPHHMIPHCRNERFFGREDTLERIDSRLSPLRKMKKQSSFALFGMGGSGKTQIALEYTYRHMRDYKAVFWIISNTIEKIEQGFGDAASLLGLEKTVMHANQARNFVLQWLAGSEDEYLLVFDNADEVALLESYWPRSDHGSILITSRDSVMSEERATAGERVTEFSVGEGRSFLTAQLPKEITNNAQDQIQQISKLFDGLPLALGLVTAFVRTRNFQLESFIKIIDDARHMRVIDSMPITGYTLTLSTVWKLSLSTLSDEALLVLRTLVYLDPDSIPYELFQKHHTSNSLINKRLSFLSNPLAFSDVTTSLRQHSLIRTNPERSTLSIHRYFQESTFRQICKDGVVRRQSFENALDLLCNIQPQDNFKQHWSPQFWEPTQKYLPHIKTLEAHFLQSPKSFLGSEEKLARLLFHCSNYLFERNRYKVGLETITTARLIAEMVNPMNAQLLSDLWRLEGRLCNENNQALRATESFKTAKELADKAVALKQMDADDTRLVRILTGWGNCLNHLERFEEALELQMQALHFCSSSPDKHGDAVLIVKLNWGYVLYRQGDLEGAERIFEETLSIDRTSQPLMYALANIAIRQQRLEDGLFFHSEALRLYIAQFGEQHHMIADSTYKVGETLLRLDRVEEATTMLRRSLTIYESEGQHFDTRAAVARSARLLAQAHDRVGKYHEGFNYYKIAWAMRKAVTGIEGSPKDTDEDYTGMMFYWSQ